MTLTHDGVDTCWLNHRIKDKIHNQTTCSKKSCVMEVTDTSIRSSSILDKNMSRNDHRSDFNLGPFWHPHTSPYLLLFLQQVPLLLRIVELLGLTLALLLAARVLQRGRFSSLCLRILTLFSTWAQRPKQMLFSYSQLIVLLTIL